MISSVCQGLQSHVESHVLSFQLFPQNPNPSYSSRFHEEGEEVEEKNSMRNRGEDCSVRRRRENGEGWSSLEALPNGNGNGIEEEKVYVHVHPLVKLSKKSLEMCTESLGSESGSDMGENDISLLGLEVDDSPSSPAPSVRRSTWGLGKKANRRSDTTTTTTTFPPPLTSISGSTGVRVESYREDGRLVLRAVATSASRTSYFHAERTQGRLKLHLVKHMEQEEDDQVLGAEVEEEAYWPETTQESHGEEMGMENFTRPCSCRCKQCRRHTKKLLNWEPLWVST